MSRKSRWIRITEGENIPVREGRAIEVEGRGLAVFNLGDRFLAVENRCPHRGGPLSDGIVAGSVVVCPLHAWKVCLEDGQVTKPADQTACVASYRTRVEGGVISIQFPAQERAVNPAAAELLPLPAGMEEQGLKLEPAAG
ncbi:MAG TPA: nitrite reductase small subunit NirD [Acidobacteriaceae bacterium]|nr:nitrite reductase small subunit NirD [Acidobacteriaceae bacterium]